MREFELFQLLENYFNGSQKGRETEKKVTKSKRVQKIQTKWGSETEREGVGEREREVLAFFSVFFSSSKPDKVKRQNFSYFFCFCF